MTTSRLFATTLGAVLGAYAGCSPDAKTSGETHWLGDCARDSDCDRGQQCLCGVCSRTCAGDGDCGGARAAQCFVTASPALAQHCGELPSSGGICLATCASNSDCRTSSACLRGACVGMPSNGGGAEGGASDSDASNSGASDSGTTSSEIAPKYVHVDAGVTFGEEAIVPPEPSTQLYRADDSLVGPWAEYGSDGERCTPEHNTAEGASVCMQLEISKDAKSGGFAATTYWLLSAKVPASPKNGPFAPASDPDHGYPTEVTLRDYQDLEWYRYPGGRYTAFEGQFEGNTLSFWISSTELWSTWCELQTPYPFRVSLLFSENFRSGYRCVPQDATPENTDLGKLSLCTAINDQSFPLDCNTESADGGINPLCSRLHQRCACYAKGCTANLRGQITSFSLTVSSATMRSTRPDAPLELRKVSP